MYKGNTKEQQDKMAQFFSTLSSEASLQTKVKTTPVKGNKKQ